TGGPGRTPSAPASRDRCASSRANPFCLHPDFLPAPFASEAHDTALVAGGIDDELLGIVEPVVHPLATLVGETEPQSKTTVRERQLVDVEPNAAELVERMPCACDEQARRVAQLE